MPKAAKILTAAETDAKAARDKVVQDAYVHATAELRKKYQTEYHGLVKAHAGANGVDWSPRPTPEQRALAQAQALLDGYPAVADLLRASDG